MCIKIIMEVMYIMPVGVFCPIADATVSFGYDVLYRIIWLVWFYIVVLFVITYGMIGGSIFLFQRTQDMSRFLK